jgi:hypothetical protein
MKEALVDFGVAQFSASGDQAKGFRIGTDTADVETAAIVAHRNQDFRARVTGNQLGLTASWLVFRSACCGIFGKRGKCSEAHSDRINLRYSP